MKTDNKNKNNELENTVSFGMIDLDKTDTIPQFLTIDGKVDGEESNEDEFHNEYEDEYEEEYEDEFQDDYDEIEDEEYIDDFEEIDNEKKYDEENNKNDVDSGPEFNEEHYGNNVFQGQIEYSNDIDDINIEESGIANLDEEQDAEELDGEYEELYVEETGVEKKERKNSKSSKNLQSNKKAVSKKASKEKANTKDNNRENNEFVEKIKKIISKMGPAEWSLVAGLIIVIVMAGVVISLLVGRNKNEQLAEGDNDSIIEIGNDLMNIGVPGESGLLAMTDALTYVEETFVEEEEIKPETDKIDVLFTSLEKDLKVKFVNTGSEKLVTGIEFKVILTNNKGNETELVDSDIDGIIYQTGLVAGDYTVSIEDVEGYSFENYDSTVNVKDKIVYKQVDVSQEVKKETEVNVAKEDTGKNNVQAEAAENYTVKDTVEWVDSSKTAADGSEGYSKIDKSDIPEPTYAFRNVIGVDNEIQAASKYSVKYKLKTIMRDPESSNEEDTGDNNEDKKEDENKEENKSENKTASISFGGNQSVNVDSSITLSPSAECDGNSLPGSGFKDYTSSDSSIASVDSGGKVTGKAEGEATIKVKYECTITEDGVTKNYTGEGSVKVTVTKVKITVTSLEVDKTAVSLAPNASTSIDAKAKLSDDSTTRDGITFTSSDEKVVKVDKDGKITAVSKGQAKITVSYKDSYDNKKEVTINVTVSDLTAKEVTLSKSNTSIGIGKTESIVPTAVMSDDSKITDAAKFSYTSDNKDIAKVDGSGVITGVKKGETKITVKYGEGDSAKSATLTVKVVEDASSDTSSKLKDKNGNQVYVKNSDDKYVEAVYADYYKADEFFISTGKGYKYTGWQTIDGNVYYFDKNGNKVTGEQVIQGVTYKFTDDGILKMDKGSTMGIDVSKWNGTIDWNAVKNSGVSFVIIRCGYRGSTSGVLVEDSKFKSNIQGAQAAGLKVGIYFFTQAVNEVEAVEEASMVIGLIRNYSIAYPVFIDTEQSGGRGDKIDRATRTAVCVAFCETIKSAGYTPGVYASKSWYNDNLSYGSISGYRIWLAQYASAPSFSNRYDIWQHSEKGSVSGISGKVDLNISYMGY